MVPALKLGNFHWLLRTQYHGILVIKYPAGALKLRLGDVYRRWRWYPLFLLVTPRPAPFLQRPPCAFLFKTTPYGWRPYLAQRNWFAGTYEHLFPIFHFSVTCTLSRRLHPVYVYTVVVCCNEFWIGAETLWIARLWDTDSQAEIQTINETDMVFE